jgi:hypothetical protein
MRTSTKRRRNVAMVALSLDRHSDGARRRTARLRARALGRERQSHRARWGSARGRRRARSWNRHPHRPRRRPTSGRPTRVDAREAWIAGLRAAARSALFSGFGLLADRLGRDRHAHRARRRARRSLLFVGLDRQPDRAGWRPARPFLAHETLFAFHARRAGFALASQARDDVVRVGGGRIVRAASDEGRGSESERGEASRQNVGAHNFRLPSNTHTSRACRQSSEKTRSKGLARPRSLRSS